MRNEVFCSAELRTVRCCFPVVQPRAVVGPCHEVVDPLTKLGYPLGLQRLGEHPTELLKMVGGIGTGFDGVKEWLVHIAMLGPCPTLRIWPMLVQTFFSSRSMNSGPSDFRLPATRWCKRRHLMRSVPSRCASPDTTDKPLHARPAERRFIPALIR